MARFAVYFEWPEASAGTQAVFDLDAQTLHLARMQAAMLFATVESSGELPSGYRIIQDGNVEVYRYPEVTWH